MKVRRVAKFIKLKGIKFLLLPLIAIFKVQSPQQIVEVM